MGWRPKIGLLFETAPSRGCYVINRMLTIAAHLQYVQEQQRWGGGAVGEAAGVKSVKSCRPEHGGGGRIIQDRLRTQEQSLLGTQTAVIPSSRI